MNFALFLLLLVVGGAAYYECTAEQQTGAGIQKQLSIWQGKVDAVQAEIEKLKPETTALTISLNQENALIAPLRVAAAKAVQEQKAIVPPPPPPKPQVRVDLNALGTISSILGQTFYKCELLKVEPDGITVSHTAGITKILFAYLPVQMQKRFGYDRDNPAALNDAELQYQEAVRKNNDASANGTPSDGQ